MPSERRGWVIGVLASAGTTCLMIGPLLGGLLVETVGWRWVFLLNVPVVALAVGLGMRFMPETREPEAPSLDVRGLLLLTIGLAGLVAGLLHLQEWPPAVDAAVLMLATLTLVAFVAVERRSEHPLLPLRLLRPPEVASSMAALLTIQGAVLGVTVYVTLFLQNGLDLSAIEAGAVLLPAMIWSAALSTWTGRMADLHGERLFVGIGLLVAAAGLAAIGLVARGEEALLPLPGLLVFGFAPPPSAHEAAPDKRWWGLGVICVAIFISAMDMTIVNVALPDMSNDLDAGIGELQWVLDAFLVSLAGLLLVGSGLADRFGRRRVFLSGFVGFAAASVLTAASQTVGEVIAGRVLMGVAAACVLPPALSLLAVLFPPELRPKALGIWAGVAGVGLALGPVLGGVLVEVAGWRWVFLVNVPFVLVAAPLGLRWLPESRRPGTPPLDLPGVALSIVALTGIVFALIEAVEAA